MCGKCIVLLSSIIFWKKGNVSTKQRIIIMVLTSTLLAVALLSLSLGAYYIAIDDVWRLILEKIGMATSDSLDADVLFVVRTPRVLLGLLVGAALGGAGAAVQGIFRNALGDPGVIGISGGVSVVAVLVVAFERVLVGGMH